MRFELPTFGAGRNPISSGFDWVNSPLHPMGPSDSQDNDNDGDDLTQRSTLWLEACEVLSTTLCP